MSIWLQSAVEHGDLIRIRKILDAIESQQDAEDKLTNPNGYSFLATCVETGQTNSLATLLEYHHKHGISLDIKHKSTGTTALHTAVQLLKPAYVKSLLLGGSFVSIKDSRGKTPLHMAIEKQNLEIVSLLLDFGANIHAKNKKGQTPIELLSTSKSELFKSQVDTKLKAIRPITVLKNRDKNKAKNIFYAVSAGDMNMTKKLLNTSTMYSLSSRGLTPVYLACKHGFLDILKYMVSQGTSLLVHNTLSTSPLHAAVENSHLHVVDYLLENNVNMYVMDNTFKVPLEVAVNLKKWEIAEKLMKKMLEVEKGYAKKSSKWNWYLRQVCKEGEFSLVKLLVDSQCVELDAQTNNGWTPLHIAVRYGKLPIIRYLLENGANASIGNSELWTPLHVACELDISPIKSDIIEFLLRSGSDANTITKSGLCPLYIAVNKGDAQAVLHIVEYGGDVNFTLRDKKLVEIALAKRHNEIVGTLLSKGATVGPTVLWEAVRVGNIPLVTNLLQGDVDVNYVHKGWSIYDMAVLKELDSSIISKMIEKGASNNPNKGGYTPLHTAVTNGNVDLVRTILATDENSPHAAITPNNNGYYPIHTAIIIKNSEIVSELLNHGADANQPFPKKSVSPLYTAVRMGDCDMVRALVSQGANSRAAGFGKEGSLMHCACNLLSMEMVAIAIQYCERDLNYLSPSGYAPIHILAMKSANSNSVEILKLLLQEPSIDVGIQATNNLRTALHFAADNGNVEFVKALLEHGNIDINAQEQRGWTPLMTAIDKGHEQTYELLLANNADPTYQGNDGWTAIHQAALRGDMSLLKRFAENPSNLNIKGKAGTPLTVALKKSNWDIIRFLLQNGSQLQVENLVKAPWTILHQAAKDGNVPMATALIEGKMPINITSDTGFTPLHIAILYNHYNLATIFLENGADVDIKSNTSGWTCLHTICKRGGNVDLLRLLLSKSADINLNEQGGLTPLDIAIDSDNASAVDVLLQHNAISRRFFINVEGKRKFTAIHWCANNNRYRVIHVLSSIIDVNAIATIHRWTALHMAAMRGHHKVIDALIEAGADGYCANRQGQTPLHIAVERNKKKAARALLKCVKDKEDDNGIKAVEIASAKGKNSMQSLVLNGAYKEYKQKPLTQIVWDTVRKVKNVWKHYIMDEMESEYEKNELYEDDIFDDEDDDIIGY